MGFTKYVDMRKTPAEKAEEVMEMAQGPSVSGVADYPYGLCLCLTHEELAKLDLDDEVEIGDMIDLRAFARVTSVNKREVNGSSECRVELQITQLAVEDEDKEEPGEA